MKTLSMVVLVVLLSLVSLVVLSDRGGMKGNPMMDEGGMMNGGGMMDGGGMGNMSMRRHRHVMRNGIDPAYADQSNPLEPGPETLGEGEKLYKRNCASCHGTAGRGNGDAAPALDPAPTNIAAFSKMPMASDAYLYWTIAEGGAPVGSAMPSFRESLEEDEIWRIIVYLRQGL